MSTKRLSKRAGYTAAAVLIATVVLASVAVAVTTTSGSPDPEMGTGGHTGDPVTYAGGVETSTPAPLTSSDATEQVAQGLEKQGQVARLEATSTPSGLALAVTLTRNNDEVPDVWIAGLAVGAVAERMHTDQATMDELIASATAVGPGKEGVPTTTNLGIGAVRLGQVFGSPSDSVLTAQVEDIAQRYGLEVADLQILHPLESALQVTLVVPDGASIDWTIDDLRAALVGESPVVEGVLIQLNDPNGKPLLLSGVAYRTGEGGLWFAPGQDSRFGAVHGGTPGN